MGSGASTFFGTNLHFLIILGILFSFLIGTAGLDSRVGSGVSSGVCSGVGTGLSSGTGERG